MLNSIVAIIAGLALLAHWLKGGAAKFAHTLAQFDVVIGVVAIVIGVLELLSLEGILLVLAGLILSAEALRSVPSIGRPLARLGDALDPFRLIIGILVLLVGLRDLLFVLLRF